MNNKLFVCLSTYVTDYIGITYEILNVYYNSKFSLSLFFYILNLSNVLNWSGVSIIHFKRDISGYLRNL